jgi:hypothetical protein
MKKKTLMALRDIGEKKHHFTFYYLLYPAPYSIIAIATLSLDYLVTAIKFAVPIAFSLYSLAKWKDDTHPLIVNHLLLMDGWLDAQKSGHTRN